MSAKPALDIDSILPAGIVPTREMVDGLFAAWNAQAQAPLTQEQILAVTGTPPLYPVSLPRLNDYFDEWGG